MVPVILTRKSDDLTYTRYVGEYLDDAYLQLLELYPDTTIFTAGLLYVEGLFIPQEYHFVSFTLAYTADPENEDYQKRIKEHAEQEAADQ